MCVSLLAFTFDGSVSVAPGDPELKNERASLSVLRGLDEA
jgi:hypothetical protein